MLLTLKRSSVTFEMTVFGNGEGEKRPQWADNRMEHESETVIIVMRDERSTERLFFIIKNLDVFIGLNRKSEWRNRGLKINHSGREREEK